MDDDVNKALEIVPQNRVFNMEYTDLGSETVLEKLLEFLGVEPYPMTAVAQKRNPSQIIECFNNPVRVMACLKWYKLSAWAEE